MNRRSIRLAAGLTLFGTVAASCGSEEQSAGTTSADVTLTLLAYSAFVPPESLATFTADTGIQVEIADAGDTGTMVSKAVLTAGKPEGDVLWGIDDPNVTRALDAGVFAPHATADLAALDSTLTAYAPELTPVDTGDVCLNIDIGWFADQGLEPPTGFDDLVDRAYRDLLVVENPATSSPGLAFVLATIAVKGTEDYLTYWKALRDNGVSVVDDWDTAYYGSFTAGGGDGDRPIVVSYASSPPATVIFAEDPKPTEPTTATVTSTCYRLAEYAGVLAGTRHPAEAGQLIDFLVSEAFQAELPLTNFVFPVRDGVELPEEFVKWAPRPDDPLRLDPADVAANRTAWIDEWTDTVLR